MKIEQKKFLIMTKNILIFFIGGILIHFLTGIIMSTSLPEILREISEEELKKYLANIDKEIFYSLIKIYLISYILFYFLPPKINKNKWYIRSLFFVIFYVFCILIYLWI